MKFQKRAFAGLAAVALIVGASACGDDDDGVSSDATEAPADGSEAPADESTDTEAPADTDAPAETEAPADSAGGDGEDAGSSELSITFLPKNLGNPYFDTSNAGGERAIEEFGGTYQEVGPDAAAPDAQVPFINTAAQQGVDALVVSANDPNALCTSLNDARDAGVAVVTFDSDTDPECRDLFINQATAEGIAQVQVELIA
jgi:rhamnose transport system substrate-binding protein